MNEVDEVKLEIYLFILFSIEHMSKSLGCRKDDQFDDQLHYLTAVGQSKTSPQKQKDVPRHLFMDYVPTQQRGRGFSRGPY